MEQIRSPRPVLAGITGVLGLVGAAVWAVMAFTVVVDGALNGTHGVDDVSVLVLLVLAVVQGWGAVRLLRRRGWGLLALGSAPGLLPLLVLLVLWTEYRQELTPVDVLAPLPVLPLVLLLLPPVRRWASPRRAQTPAGHAVTTSGA